MDIWTIFAVLILAGLIHASFHLSVSVLTLLSGHTLSRERSHLKLVKLTTAFTIGAGLTNILLFCAIAFILQLFKVDASSPIIWTIIMGLLAGTGIAVWLFYYKKPSKKSKVEGTQIWIPRDMAKFLNERARKTRHSAEAFSLGSSSILSELIFIIAPLITAIILSLQLPTPSLQLVGVLIYALTATFPLVAITILVSGGKSIAKIQLWREHNKYFLQLASSIGLLVMAIFLYAYILSPVVAGVSL
ncbi:MAG: hypothetical protein KIG14_00475 [Candidatus Sacchiramonaceae bacterium]|jgi:cbb3-type cytochrome oxidase subunit 3|nr:hypothetical protein [Candidatus Saccharimonadaceae bacterium]